MNTTENSLSSIGGHTSGQPLPPAPESGLLRLCVVPEVRKKIIDRGQNFSHFTFLVRIDVPEVPVKSSYQEIPLSLAIAIDTSGSMSPRDRLPTAIETAKFVLTDLSRNKEALLHQAHQAIAATGGNGTAHSNEVSLLSFSSAVRQDLQLTVLTPETTPTAFATLTTLKAGGSTVLYDAILASVNSLPLSTPTGRSAAVLLLSDGEDSGSSPGSHAAAIAAARSKKVRVHTLGLGAGHDTVSMRAIAKATGGSYFSISHPESISDAAAMIISTEQLQRAENVTVSINITNESDSDNSRRVSIESIQSVKTINKCFISTGDKRDARLEIGNFCEGDSLDFLVNVVVQVGTVDAEWGDYDEEEISLKLHATAECTNSKTISTDILCSLQTPDAESASADKAVGSGIALDNDKKSAEVTSLQMMVLTQTAIAAVAALRDTEEKGGKTLTLDAEPSQARARRAITTLRALRRSSSRKETRTVYRSQLRILKRAVRLCSMPVNHYRGVGKVLLTNETSLEDLVPRTSHASYKMASYSRSKSGRPMHAAYSSSEVKEGLGAFVPADDADSDNDDTTDDSEVGVKTAATGGVESSSSDPTVTVEESISASAMVGNKRKRST